MHIVLQNLQDFLDLYYEACSVLVREEDFYDLAMAYLRRASVDNVYVSEVFFDPQTHTERGVAFDVVINGLHRAFVDGFRRYGIRGSLIMCFLRHLSEESALATLEAARPHLDKIIAIGLDSGEEGNPPNKFQHVYEKARSLGLKLVAHAGEEAGPSYIMEALDLLGVARIDHGVQCLKSDALVERLVKEKIPLTTCPLSNEKLKVNSRFFNGRNVTKELLDKGLKVTINSDDPAYFGGYITENFLKTVRECSLTEAHIYTICRNSFNASFLSLVDKEHYLREIDRVCVAMGYKAPPRSVTFFGSRSPKPSQYELCLNFSRAFSARGYAVVSGGYSGLMEAASRGATEGTSVGVLAPRVFAGRHHTGNQYINEDQFARGLTERIDRLVQSSEYFFICGGTIGTITELFVAWNAAALREGFGGIPQRILLLREAWEECLGAFHTSRGVYPHDVALLTFVDSADEAVRIVEEDMKARTEKATL